MNLRSRRIDSEWELLVELASANPTSLAAVTRCPDEFHVIIYQSPAWISTSGEPLVETEHSLRIVFPRFYPALPLEAYFARPILHINVDPGTGFVCLWRDYRPSRTVVDALLVARSIMAHETANWDPVHCMQPDAVNLCRQLRTLPMPSLKVPENCRLVGIHRRSHRPRLSSDALTNATSE